MARLPEVVTVLLDSFSVRKRRVRLLHGVGETVLVLMAGVAIVAAVDALARPGRGTLLTLAFLAYGIAAAVLAARAISPYLCRKRPADVALDIERAVDGRLEERLSSAVELAASPPPGVSRWMIDRTVALAAQEAATLDPAALVDTRPTRLLWKRAGAVLAVAAVACLFAPVRGLALRALLPGVNLARPGLTALDVSPGDCRVPFGASLSIKASAIPGPGSAAVEIAWEDGLVEHLSMEEVPSDVEAEGAAPLSDRAGPAPSGGRAAEDVQAAPGRAVNTAVPVAPGRFRLQMSALRQGFTYVVQAGDAESKRFTVGVDQPPRLSEITLRVVPPAYMDASPLTIPGGDAEVVMGTEVTVTAVFEGRKADAVNIELDPGGRVAMNLAGLRARHTWRPQETVNYGLSIVGADGLAASVARQWRIKVIPDEPPTVKLAGNGIETGVVGFDEVVLLDANASDDIGLKKLDIEIAAGDRPGQTRRIALPKGPCLHVELPVAVDFGRCGLSPGETVKLRLVASDVGGHTTAGRWLELVAATGEQAKFAAMAARLREQMHRLSEQEDLLRRQARSWADMRLAYRPDDPGALRGAMVVGQRRLADVARAVAGIAAAVGEEALAMDGSLGLFTNILGGLLGEWAKSQGDILSAAAAVMTECEPDQTADAIEVAQDLTVSATGEISRLRGEFGVLVARVEAEGLVGRAEAAEARQARTVPVVRGYHGWDEIRTEPGLLASFYAGTTPVGAVRHQAVGVPDLTNYSVPGIGAQNWSVRYQGEISIPADGEYEFVVTADDGVKLFVDERELVSAWIDQGATTYRQRANLTAGWHPIEVLMYEGGGPSRLWLGIASPGVDARAVTVAETRHSDGAVVHRKALTEEMALLPREVLDKADERLVADFGALAAVPGRIAQMAEESALAGLRELARQVSEKAGQIRGALADAKAKGWTVLSLNGATEQAEPMLQAARAARDQLEKRLAEFTTNRRFSSGDIGDMRKAVARLRERMERLVDASRERPESERNEIFRRTGVYLRAEAAHLARKRSEASAAMAEVARRPDSSRAARHSAIETKRALDAWVAEKLDQAVQSAQQPVTNAEQTAGNMWQRLREVDEMLQHAERAETGVRMQRQAELAAEALQTSDDLARERELGDLAGEQSAFDKVAEQTKELTREQKRENDFEQAAKVEKAVGQRPSELQKDPLDRQLRDVLARATEAAGRLPGQFAERLEKSRRELAQAPPQTARRIEDSLSAMPLEMGIVGNDARKSGDEPRGLAYEQLGRDLADAIRKPGPMSAPELEPFVKRAADLEGRRGWEGINEARKAAEERAKKDAATDPQLARAAGLEALAELARKAEKDEMLRPDVREQLRQAAGLDARDQEAAQEAARAEDIGALASKAQRKADDLDRLQDEIADAREEVDAARREFARIEREIAGALRNLEGVAGRTAGKLDVKDLAGTVEHTRRSLPAEAFRVEELAEEADPKPGARPSPAGRAPKGEEDQREAAKRLAERAAEVRKLADKAADLAREAASRRKEAADSIRDEATAAQARTNEGLTRQREASERLSRAAEDLAADPVSESALRTLEASELAEAAGIRRAQLGSLGAKTERIRDGLDDLGRRLRDVEPDDRVPPAALNLAGDIAREAAALEDEADRLSQEANREMDEARGLAEFLAKATPAGDAEEAARAMDRERARVAEKRAAAEELDQLADAARYLAGQVGKQLREIDRPRRSRAGRPLQDERRDQPPPDAAFVEALAQKAAELARGLDAAAAAAEIKELAQAGRAAQAAGELAERAGRTAQAAGERSPAAKAARQLADQARQVAEQARRESDKAGKLADARQAARAGLDRSAGLERAATKEAARAREDAGHAGEAAEHAEEAIARAEEAMAAVPAGGQAVDAEREAALKRSAVERAARELRRGRTRAGEAARHAENSAALARQALEAARRAGLVAGKAAPEPVAGPGELSAPVLFEEAAVAQRRADDAQRAADEAAEEATRAHVGARAASDDAAAAHETAKAAVAQMAQAQEAVARTNAAFPAAAQRQARSALEQATQQAAQSLEDAARQDQAARDARAAAGRALDRANVAQETAAGAQHEANEAHKEATEAAGRLAQGLQADPTGAPEVASLAERGREAAEAAARNASKALRNAEQAAGMARQAKDAADAERQAGRNAARAKGLAESAQQLAKRAEELGRAVAEHAVQPDPADMAQAASNAELAARARDSADTLQFDLARPLAEAYRVDGAAVPDEEKIAPVRELGREIAELAARQRRAADLLDGALERQDDLRDVAAKELAQGEKRLADVEEAMEEPEAPPPAEIAAKARQARQAAHHAQQEANEAQRKADAAHAAAHAARKAAERAHAGATPQEQAERQNALTAAERAAMAAQQEAMQRQAAAHAQHAAARAAHAALPRQQAAAHAMRATAEAHQAQENAAHAMENARAMQSAHRGEAGEMAEQAAQAMKSARAAAGEARKALQRATGNHEEAVENLSRRLADAAEAARRAAERREAHAQMAHEPRAGEPHAGKPHAGEPKAGKPHAGEPKAGTPHAGEPKAGTPHAGEPKAGTPHAGEPKAGTPHAGEPKAGTPHAGEPKAGTPHAGEPKAGTPHAGEPKAGTPHAGEPKVGTPHAGEPKAGTPHAGEPKAGTPHAGEPKAGAPHAGEPKAGTPHAGKPKAGTPHAGKPGPGKPGPGTPHAGEPHAGQPGQGQPSPTQAAANQALATIEAAPNQGQSYRQAAEQLAQAASQARLAQTMGQQPGKESGPSSMFAPSDSTAPTQPGGTGGGQRRGAPTGDLTGFDMIRPGLDQADWARLPDRVRDAIRSGGVESFAEEHQEAIRAYFRRLGEER